MELNQQRDDEMEIDLRELFSVLLSKMVIIILTGIMFALITMVGTNIFITPQYQSVTKMYVLAKQNNDALTNSDLQTSTLLTKDYEELIQSRTVTESVIAKLELDIRHEDLIGKMEVSTMPDTRIVTIKVLDEDPYMAKKMADVIRDTAAEHIKNVMNSEAVNVVDEANIPSQQYSPNIMKNGILAAFFGWFLAISIILVRHISNDTIKTSEDVERYLQLSTLGTIPLNKKEAKSKKKRLKNIKGVTYRGKCRDKDTETRL